MAELLLRILKRAGQTVNNPFAMNDGYTLPKHGEAQLDWQAVSGDFYKVSKELNKVVNRELKEHVR
jgi:hypothetical protein